MSEKKPESTAVSPSKSGAATPESNVALARKGQAPKVSLRLPRARGGQEDTVFIGVNGKAWRIRRGVTVEVPAAVAEVLRNSLSAEERAELYKSTLG